MPLLYVHDCIIELDHASFVHNNNTCILSTNLLKTSIDGHFISHIQL